MADVSDAGAEVLNFREEARGCLQLAQAEEVREVRTLLMGMAIGWLDLANGNPRPTLTDNRNERDEKERRFDAVSGVAGCPTFVSGSDYCTIMAKAVGALHPNTGDERRRLYERARTALLTELRSADPSDIIAAQMLLELAIGEVEADAERDQRARQTMDDPSTVWPPDSEPGREPEMISLTRLRAEEAQPGA